MEKINQAGNRPREKRSKKMNDLATNLATTLAVRHAENELKLAGFYDKESGYERRVAYNVIELVKLFADQEHSWTTAHHCLEVFNRLALFNPLTPLTGADDEWEVMYDGEWRNIRCHRVYMDADGGYDIDAKIFRGPDGFCSVNPGQHTDIEFPYSPKTEYVDIDTTPAD